MPTKPESRVALLQPACSEIPLQVIGFQSSVFGYPCQHSGADFIPIVKCKHVILPSIPG